VPAALKAPLTHSFVIVVTVNSTLLLTVCGLTSQKTHRGGLGLSGLVHEEAHPGFPYSAQSPLKDIDAGSTNCLLVQLIPPINYSIRVRTDPGKVWKVLEFYVEIFKALKTLENEHRYGKVWKNPRKL